MTGALRLLLFMRDHGMDVPRWQRPMLLRLALGQPFVMRGRGRGRYR